MASYFIFNGIDSRKVAGLIVTSLPNIIKPAKKYTLTDIEGKNGDKIEVNGYAACDITVSVGLTRDFDINEIIEWLDTDVPSKLILSTEPNMYYEAQIVSQIDFKRLLRFRTADITFHVQPFKYYLDEKEDVLEVNSETSLTVYSKGNYKSEPVITIEGSGKIELSVNGKATCTYTFPENESKVVLDSEQQDSYLDGIYKNRNMAGNFIELKCGRNIISWTGNLAKIKVNPRSRWR